MFMRESKTMKKIEKFTIQQAKDLPGDGLHYIARVLDVLTNKSNEQTEAINTLIDKVEALEKDGQEDRINPPHYSQRNTWKPGDPYGG